MVAFVHCGAALFEAAHNLYHGRYDSNVCLYLSACFKFHTVAAKYVPSTAVELEASVTNAALHEVLVFGYSESSVREKG